MPDKIEYIINLEEVFTSGSGCGDTVTKVIEVFALSSEKEKINFTKRIEIHFNYEKFIYR
jgi:hypothetical protein